jgi:hypothetical protein
VKNNSESIQKDPHQNSSVGGEAQAGDTCGILVELAEPLLVGTVPDVDEAVGAAGGERVVLAVEGDGVHL